MIEPGYMHGSISNKVISLRVLLPLLMLLAVLVMMGFEFVLEMRREAEFIYAEHRDRQMDTVLHLQASIEHDVRIADDERIQQYFAELSAVPEVFVAMLADQQGRIIASTRLSLKGSSVSQVALQLSLPDWLKAFPAGDVSEMTIKQTVDRERNAILVVAPVRMDAPGSALARSRIGMLFIYTDMKGPLAAQSSHVKTQMRQLLIGLVGIAFVIGFLLHWTVTRRVVKLLHAAGYVGEGNLNISSGVGGLDEIGRLGTAFDGMVQKMARSSLQIHKLSAAVEQSPNSIIITDVNGLAEYVNPHFCTVTGYAAEEVRGKSLHLHQSGRADEEVYDEVWHTIKSGQVWRGEMHNRNKHGRMYWEDVVVSPIFDERGKITNFLSEQIDITARKQAEEQVRLFERVFVNANEAIMITDADNNILAINPAFTVITGYSAEEVAGKNPRMLASGLMDSDFYKSMWSEIKVTGKWQGEMVDRRKNGEIFAEWLSISALRDLSGKLTHYVALMTDISERKAAEERMVYLAQHDLLTGLPNRVLFQDRLQQAINHAERQQTNVALLFLDLDRFKDVNDTLGHNLGDLLLKEVAHRIQQSVRSSDTISRQGGDEFVIMLPDLVDLGDIMLVVDKLIDSMDKPYDLNGHIVYVTTSIGVSVYPQDGVDIETLIRNADTAMYQAKDAGRNDYRFFTQEMNRSISKRVGLENKLRAALAKNEFLLYYQPKIDLRSGEIVSAEALVRWQHPVDGLISPADFIPIAEETGMIIPIGEWVLNEACRQNQEWFEQGLCKIVMAVNLSPVQFHERNLNGMIQAALKRSGMPASALEIEITESSVMRDHEIAIPLLKKISASGIRISIDDFGTGYSSLSHLKKFPIDELKIDQSFVRDLSADADDAAIVSAIIGMAKSLGLSVIAEGVETVEQLRFLKKLECDKMQGYYFSKPLPADEFRKLLESGRVLSQS